MYYKSSQSHFAEISQNVLDPYFRIDTGVFCNIMCVILVLKGKHLVNDLSKQFSACKSSEEESFGKGISIRLNQTLL